MLNVNGVEASEYLEYKGRPLVRKDNDIYYGDLSEDFHVFMMIMAEVPSAKGVDVPATVMIQMLAKDDPKPVKQAVYKTLTEALETASIWLDRYNK